MIGLLCLDGAKAGASPCGRCRRSCCCCRRRWRRGGGFLSFLVVFGHDGGVCVCVCVYANAVAVESRRFTKTLEDDTAATATATATPASAGVGVGVAVAVGIDPYQLSPAKVSVTQMMDDSKCRGCGNASGQRRRTKENDGRGRCCC